MRQGRSKGKMSKEERQVRGKKSLKKAKKESFSNSPTTIKIRIFFIFFGWGKKKKQHAIHIIL